MKTAMQELIDNYYKLETINEFISWFSGNEKKLLELEKEQIIAAKNDPTLKSPTEYYNQTYNQNK
jgi:hypothetical protein